jgi:hypothetical protein
MGNDCPRPAIQTDLERPKWPSGAVESCDTLKVTQRVMGKVGAIRSH